MSTDLLNYCCEQLLSHPRALNIRTPLDLSARNSFIRFWSKARFEAQQQSILVDPTDHPNYGRGYLWPYELVWHEIPEDPRFLLRIEFNLNTPAPLRELILLASVCESPIKLGDCSSSLFRATKTRMMGRENKRVAGAVLPILRPLVANVQYTCQGGTAYASAINLPDFVDIEP